MQGIKISTLILVISFAQGQELYETDYGYNALDKVIHLSNNSLIEFKQLSGFTYSYDANNNINSLSKVYNDKAALNSGYAYDAANRLVSDAETTNHVTSTTEYAFDLQSNIRQEGTGSNWTIRAYNPRNQLSYAQGVSFDYSAAGNLITNSKGQQFDYNALDELTRYDATDYTYDGNGERLSKSNALGLQSFYYRDMNLINSQDPGNLNLTSYLSGIDKEAYIANGQPQFYQSNVHRDIVQLTDEQGQVIENYDYDVYGLPKATASSSSNPYRYAGYFYDAESGLYYLNKRYYNPATQTFMTQDSYRNSVDSTENLNLYSYVNGQPTMGFDPTGQSLIRSDAIRISAWVFGAVASSAAGYIGLQALKWGWQQLAPKFKYDKKRDGTYPLLVDIMLDYSKGKVVEKYSTFKGFLSRSYSSSKKSIYDREGNIVNFFPTARKLSNNRWASKRRTRQRDVFKDPVRYFFGKSKGQRSSYEPIRRSWVGVEY